MTNPRNEIDKDKLRESVRASMESNGPLKFDEKYKDKNFMYYWDVYDTKEPFKFNKCLDLGYTHCKAEEMPGLVDSGPQKGFSLIDDQGQIGVKISGTQTQYLMKIPLDRWKLIQEFKHEETNNKVSLLKQRLRNAQILGDAKMHSGSLNSTKNY